MPPLPNVSNVLKFRIIGNDGGAVWNVNHFVSYTTGTAPSNTQMDSLCASVLTNYATFINTAKYSTATDVNAVQGIDLSTTTGSVGSAATVTHGTNPSVPTAAQVCVLVSHRIARHYRGGHPRTYMPGFSTASLVDSTHWGTTDVAAQQTLYTALVNSINTAVGLVTSSVCAHVNVSYHSGHALRPVPVVDGISGSTVQTLVATQRRRVPR